MIRKNCEGLEINEKYDRILSHIFFHAFFVSFDVKKLIKNFVHFGCMAKKTVLGPNASKNT